MRHTSIYYLNAALLCVLPLTTLAKTYTYEWEGFEEAQWTSSGNATVESSTGTWTTNKNVSTQDTHFDGEYSLYLSYKSGIMLPELTDGAGALIYYVKDSNRQVYVETSCDGAGWTRVEEYKETADWTRHIVPIFDGNVRFVRITSTSNGNVYLDNIVLTKSDGAIADGTSLIPSVDVPYFTNDFEDNGSCPASKEDCLQQTAVSVPGQGEWLFYNAYKGTNVSYIVDGSSRSLRMLKNGSYAVTPVLAQGVARLKFNEGRRGRSISVYGSHDAGGTWELLRTLDTQSENVLDIYDSSIDRLKIVNSGSSDADVDNLCVTGYPRGVPASVRTGDVVDVHSSKATVSGNIIDKGDGRMIEWGVCWSTDSEDCDMLRGQRVIAGDDDFDVTIAGLPCESEVFYRSYALSMAGVAYGDVKCFNTLAPSVAVVKATMPAIDNSIVDDDNIFVNIEATVVDDGGVAPADVGFCYNTSGDPTIDDTVSKAYLYGDKFASTIAMMPQTTYYIRAYSASRAGIGYSGLIVYTTPALALPDYQHRTYYVSPSGNDTSGDGSEVSPFFNLQSAVDLAAPGDTIYMLAGTYMYNERINIPTIGEPNRGMISIIAKDGRAVLDFRAMPLADANQGIRLTGSYWYLWSLDICNAGDNGLLIERNKPSGGNYNSIKGLTEQAHDNVIENCRFYRNRDSGLQMKNLAENNRVINCDSYFNADPDYEDADGFAVKISHGTGNYFYGCRAWRNCDDGWDGFVKTDGGFPDDCTTTYECCWAFYNGYLEEGGATSNGDGNGFKLGSAYGAHNAVLNRCLAFENYQKGFDQNHNTGSMILNNCTGFALPLTSNKSHYTYRIDEPVSAGHEVRLVNCVAVSDGISDRNKSSFAPYSIAGDRLTVTTSDFCTVPSDYQSIDPAGADADRDDKGNLPYLPFMRIAAGNSRLIDQGTSVPPYPGESRHSVGISYSGAAPDLGCFEADTDSGIDVTLSDTGHWDVSVMEAKPLASGLLLVTVRGLSDTAEHTIVVCDAAGRMLTAHTFLGSATVVNPGAQGVVILSLVSGGAVASCKAFVR